MALKFNPFTSNFDYDTSTSSGSSVAATTQINITQTSHGFSVGDVVRLVSGSANTYTKAQADSAANAEVVGIVTVVLSANSFTLVTEGVVTTGVPGEAAGTVMFLSPSTAGALTATEPSSVGQVSKPLAIILETSVRMLFSNYRGELLSDSGGGGGTALTIEDLDGTPSVANVDTIKVTNGTLTDNGDGSVTIDTGLGGSGTPGGSDTQVQFNDSSSFGGDAGLVYNKTTNKLTAGIVSSGSYIGGYTSKTANYTATTDDYFLAGDASGGSFTFTLPAASGNTGLQFFFKKIDTSGNTITIDGNASETIDGATTRVINTQYETVGIICNGSNWYVI